MSVLNLISKQFKNTMKCHYTFTRMAKYQVSPRMQRKWNTYLLLVEMQSYANTEIWSFLVQENIHLPSDPTIPLGYTHISKRNEFMYLPKDVHTIHSAALFIKHKLGSTQNSICAVCVCVRAWTHTHYIYTHTRYSFSTQCGTFAQWHNPEQSKKVQKYWYI